MNNITDKEWLDLGFKYFVQHSQQRVQHFNYFILFSSLLTTATVTSMQPSFGLSSFGALFGLIQMIISFIFIKIDDRNSFLIKHSESIIKKIENKYLDSDDFRIFSLEEKETIFLRSQKNGLLKTHFSHKNLYRITYVIFGIIGAICLMLSFYRFLTQRFN
ncbi:MULTISPECIES: hypothetical protein [Sphingobacterium]|uniref:RipA family octameric membrane protein n=1 Tax=Sphingobacterium TaxID=28453 RepID=UPI00257B2299|nr:MULTISPECIES: hypothetical protein [Sphingobacterium]